MSLLESRDNKFDNYANLSCSMKVVLKWVSQKASSQIPFLRSKGINAYKVKCMIYKKDPLKIRF